MPGKETQHIQSGGYGMHGVGQDISRPNDGCMRSNRLRVWLYALQLINERGYMRLNSQRT